MNKIKKITFVLLFLLACSVAIASSTVTITPSNPFTTNNLDCRITGTNQPELYDYQWYRNGQLTGYSSNTLSYSSTSHLEEWKCEVYYPPTSYTGPIYLGAAAVTIQNSNPEITSAPVTSATNDETYTYDVEATDPDGDSLSYSLISAPANMSINSDSGLISWTPPVIEDCAVSVKVSDGYGSSAEQSFTITILPPPGYGFLKGTIYDTDNSSFLAGVNLSFYNSSIYDPSNNTGNYSALKPKNLPDIFTDGKGHYFIRLPKGIYHLIMKHSDEKDFNIYVDEGKKKTHDAELDEDRPATNFNAEGHILYSGKYEHNNSYTCGDKVKFTMFGVNNGSTNETITFLIQNHTSVGGPTAPIAYYGNISNENESLIVPAGNKTHKVFEFTIPCSYTLGRYDIHVVWYNKTWHKIGNFFVVDDSTAPEVTGDSAVTTYTNQSVEIGYSVNDIAEPGTVRIQEVSIASDLDGITVYFDKDIADDSDNDTITDNDPDYDATASFSTFNVTYNKSGHYTARIFAVDGKNNTGEHFVNVSVYITEGEADTIGDAIYGQFGLGGFLVHDYNYTVVSSSPDVFTVWDRFTNDDSYGDEYITPNNGLNETEVSALEEVNYGKSGPEYAKPIYPMITNEYNYTLTSFFTLLKCVPPTEPLGGPACSFRNFVPEIWKYNPTTNQTINSNSSQNFQISVVDPNNDVFTTYWYDDENLKQTNGTSYTFIANSSLIGTHIIKTIALDSSGENISIANGPHNSQTWTLTVTE